ncbi:MAG: DNA-processing protein DprA, partial [Thermoanaerobaculia bacterium]|nr:DNA-processing protein DprA [Thermoanaerobaculia bacterium]
MNPKEQRTVLLALNAAPDLQRATKCRLGSDPVSWTGSPPPGGLKELARRCQVPVSHLKTARRLLGSAGQIATAEEKRAERLGARIVTLGDEEYPESLHQLPLPPPVLYLRGRLPPGPSLAMVGSRACSPYGREAAHFFASHLARGGVPVVSGFARGIDQTSHKGALEPSRGRTVAVLGCGLDVPYPRGTRDLADRIGDRGALVTEFPLGTPPRKRNFPTRNRIIAALAEGGTLVVEAAPRSGSLITARHALELGREIYALPGRIFDEKSLGTNALLRDGATPALHPVDILRSLGVA